MTNHQILEKAIQKAIDGGWDYRGFVHEDDHTPLRNPDVSIYEIIFNHQFAKALWGDGFYKPSGVKNIGLLFERSPEWKWRLQDMVIAKDPIKYLGENI